MALVINNNAEVIMLRNITNNTAPENLVLKLYSNNVTPTETDAANTYTEASGGGYAAVGLVAANWNFSSGDPAVADYPQVTWTFTGTVGNIYGYFVVQATSGLLIWAERFTNGPYNIQNNGDQIRMTARIELS